MARSATAGDATIWAIDSVSSIGGHDVTVFGSPRIIDTPAGKAVEFNGDGDGLLIPGCNPCEGLASFTAEMIFMPYSNGPQEQRFFHMQESGEGNGNRVLLETRTNGWTDSPPPDGTSSQSGDELVTLPADVWFADACLQSAGPSVGEKNLAIQFATNCTHPVDTWYAPPFPPPSNTRATSTCWSGCTHVYRMKPLHVCRYNITVTVEGSTLKHYVNGVEERSPARSHSPHDLPHEWVALGPGSTSLGMRINAVSW